MRVIHLTVEGATLGYPPCLVCYKRRRNCVKCDLRYQCLTKNPFVLGTVNDENENHVVTRKWLIDNLEYHENGYELVWKDSKSPQSKGSLNKWWGK